MEEERLEAKVQIFASLADKTRLSLIKKIAEGPIQGSSCTSLQAQFNLSQPAMSHHFKILTTSGVVKQRKDGRSVFYTVDQELLDSAGIDINNMLI
jgi:DNA-binding transcriptional ArsR family regulator